MLKLLLAMCLYAVFLLSHAGTKDDAGLKPELSAESVQMLSVPPKAEAEKWLAAFSEAREKTGDALFLLNFGKRQLHTKLLMALREQAERLFGDVVGRYGDCTKAAELVSGYWKTEISMITDPANNQVIKTAGLVGTVWDGGMHFASCRRLILELH